MVINANFYAHKIAFHVNKIARQVALIKNAKNNVQKFVYLVKNLVPINASIQNVRNSVLNLAISLFAMSNVIRLIKNVIIVVLDSVEKNAQKYAKNAIHRIKLFKNFGATNQTRMLYLSRLTVVIFLKFLDSTNTW